MTSGLCECGCGLPTGPGSQYRQGHNRRALTEFRFDGTKQRWYVVMRNGKRYLWYRVVMWNKLGRELDRGETVHHINGDSTDDRPENLALLSPSEHSRLHGSTPEVAERMRRANAIAARNRDTRIDVVCAGCQVTFRAPRWRRERYGELYCTVDCANEARREGKTGIKRVMAERAA